MQTDEAPVPVPAPGTTVPAPATPAPPPPATATPEVELLTYLLLVMYLLDTQHFKQVGAHGLACLRNLCIACSTACSAFPCLPCMLLRRCTFFCICLCRPACCTLGGSCIHGMIE